MLPLSLFLLSSFSLSYISLSRDSHAGPEEPGLQCDPHSTPEGGAGQDKEEAAGQRCPLHLGDGRGQVHAALLPHWLLALLWEAQWRFVMGAESMINDRELVVKHLSLYSKVRCCKQQHARSEYLLITLWGVKIYSKLLFRYFPRDILRNRNKSEILQVEMPGNFTEALYLNVQWTEKVVDILVHYNCFFCNYYSCQ